MTDNSYKLTINKINKAKYCVNISWIVLVNTKYYDIIDAFKKHQETIWKQSSNVVIGDIVYTYLASPYLCIMYKTKAIEVNIPCKYSDKNISMTKIMKLQLLKQYKKDEISLKMLKNYGIRYITGSIKMNNSVKWIIEKIEKKREIEYKTIIYQPLWKQIYFIFMKKP